MPYDTLNTPQVFIPPAAAGISVTVAGSWAAGTWFQLTADSGAVPLMLTTIVARTTASGMGNASLELEVGVGGAGAETVIASSRGFIGNFAPTGQLGGQSLTLPVNAIPAHSRIAMRGRAANGSTFAMLIGVQATPTPLAIEVAPGPPLLMKTRAAVPTIAWNTVDGANSAYQELVAATATALAIAAYYRVFSSLGGTYPWAEFDLAIGAAGAEVPFLTLLDAGGTLGTQDIHDSPEVLPNPPRIAAGQRVAFRGRKGGTTAGNFGLDCLYWGLP